MIIRFLHLFCAGLYVAFLIFIGSNGERAKGFFKEVKRM